MTTMTNHVMDQLIKYHYVSLDQYNINRELEFFRATKAGVRRLELKGHWMFSEQCTQCPTCDKAFHHNTMTNKTMQYRIQCGHQAALDIQEAVLYHLRILNKLEKV